MNNYKNLNIESYDTFKNMLKKVQKYVTESKYFINNSKNGEKKKFTDYFCLNNWLHLPEADQKQHTIDNCIQCMTVHASSSSLHKSFSNASILEQSGSMLLKNIENLTPPNTKPSQKKGQKAVETMMKVLQPVVERKYDTNFKNAVAESLSLQPKETAREAKKKVKKIIHQTKHQIEESMQENDNDLDHLLGSGQSFAQYERDRINSCFIGREQAEKVNMTQQTKIETGKKKPKDHIGRIENYTFNRNEFLEYVKTTASKQINWSQLAKQYQVSCNGKAVNNGGQVLKKYAYDQGIDISKFNQHLRVSGREYKQRIRKSKKRKMHKLPVPSRRSIKLLKTILKKKIQDNTYDIGVKIAPKAVQQNKIGPDGNIITTTVQVPARKISLRKIFTREIRRLKKLGVVRQKTDHTLFFKLWHDHSAILNHSYVSFMVSLLYETSTFLTNEEYKTSYPQRQPVDVQTAVERPNLYIFGQSGKHINIQ